MPENNKVGLIQFTILTTVSMTVGIIMLPTMVATVGAISVYAWIETIICVMILAHAFAKCGAYSKKAVVLVAMRNMLSENQAIL